jgi:hypothetical protein
MLDDAFSLEKKMLSQDSFDPGDDILSQDISSEDGVLSHLVDSRDNIKSRESTRPNDSAHLFVFTNDKAGMGAVDKSRINKTIYDMSKVCFFIACIF